MAKGSFYDGNTGSENLSTTAASSAATATARAAAAAASASASAASAAAALVSEGLADTDAIATAADVVLTNADVVLTNADVVSTAYDAAATAADVVLTNADVVLTAADAAATALDKIATNADVVLTAADVVSTAADLVATNQDTIDTADDLSHTIASAAEAEADAVLTAADVVSTAADLVATNQDTIDTAADLVLTNADVVLTNADVVLTNADVVLTNADVVLTAADVVSAESAKTAAETAQAAAELALDNFDDVYLGAKASNPTLDNDGDALNAGDLYFNTTNSKLMVYLGSVWSEAAVDSSTFLQRSGGAMTGAITTNSTFDGRDVATDGTKLDGIEASADVTDTINVTAAGALMDSELAGIAAVKATTAAFLVADLAHLDGIEASADVTDTINVTAAGALMDSELAGIAAVKATTAAFLVADLAHLDGIEASADVTDTINVTAAGALMDSELAGIAAVKATTAAFLVADLAHLDGIESDATADQTDAEIRAAVDAATNSNVLVDTDKAKLDNQYGQDSVKNIGYGDYADYSNLTTGEQNSLFGYAAGQAIVDGSYNSAFGYFAGNDISSGSRNNLFGYAAGSKMTTGAYNIAIGHASLYNNLVSTGNVALGYNALYNTTDEYNTAVGYQSQYNTTTGGFNTTLGYKSGNNITTGDSNIVIGDFTAVADPTGSDQLNIGDTITGTLGATGSITFANDVTVAGSLNIEDGVASVIERGTLTNVTTSAAEWRNIAWIDPTDSTSGSGERATAKFQIVNRDSGNHQQVVFYASHNYGRNESNVITVLTDSSYGSLDGGFSKVRILESSTYDGAVLQVYFDAADTIYYCQVSMTENEVTTGWQLLDWTAEASIPISGLTEPALGPSVDLAVIAGLNTNQDIYSKGSKVMTEASDTLYSNGVQVMRTHSEGIIIADTATNAKHGVLLSKGGSENGGEIQLMNRTGAVGLLLDYYDPTDYGAGSVRCLHLGATSADTMSFGTYSAGGGRVNFLSSGTEVLGLETDGTANFSGKVYSDFHKIISIADDSTGIVEAPYYAGICTIIGNYDGLYPNNQWCGEFYYDVGTSASYAEVDSTIGSAFALTTVNLLGTTGVDGNITVTTGIAGNLKIENRTGYTFNFSVHYR